MHRGVYHAAGLPNPALGENGTASTFTISSQVNSHFPPEFCQRSPAQTSFVRGDPPMMNNLTTNRSLQLQL